MTTDDLQPHPEGGRFQEVFRSEDRVVANDRERAALTHIYFALSDGECSRWHPVASDEVWNLYRGRLRLWLWDGRADAVAAIELSEAVQTFCHVVPAGWWQAAEPIEGDVLVGCTVGPGFEFDDFELIDSHSSTAARLQEIAPGGTRLITG